MQQITRYALVALSLAATSACAAPMARTGGTVFTSLSALPPAAPGMREPALFALSGGRAALGWSEPAPEGFAVRIATGDLSGFSPASTVAAANLFVNWADFPSVAAFRDGTLAVHYLQENGTSTYDYNLKIALSVDSGATFAPPIRVDRAKRPNQYGPERGQCSNGRGGGG